MQRNLKFFSHVSNLIVVLFVAGSLQVAPAQNADSTQAATHQSGATKEPSGLTSRPVVGLSEQNTSTQRTSAAPVLGPGDEVEVTVYGALDLSGRTRVDSNGNISMPLVGYIRVAGLSSSEAEEAIETQLRQNHVVNNPQVSVYVKEYTSSGISVAGEVSKPGVYSAVGPHRLFDILQAAGGLSEKATGLVTISRQGRETPITVEFTKNPTEMVHNNVELLPGDTVFAAKAAIVYVLGEVNKPGAYILNSTGGATVLQVVAAAGGPTHSAAPGGTRMLRRTPNGLQELPVPLKALLRGKTADIPVSAEDILFVPSSRMKTMIGASTLVATSAATAAVYRVF
jgi:polysaccharide export outer membrane protein